MEIKIGVQNVQREIRLESDETADAIAKAVTAAVAGATLELTDNKGRRIVVPSASLAYVEIGEETKNRVGFAS